jgi:hypothetical protein
LSASPYYYLGYCSCLLLFPIALFIRSACVAALGDLGALGRSPKVCKEST